MQIKKISDIAELQSGLVMNRIEAESDSETPYFYPKISLRSLNKSGSIDKNEIDHVYSKKRVNPDALTKKDDILVKLFTPIYPTLVTDNEEGFLIPSQIVVIRIKNACILPEYLRYCLSTPEVTDSLLTEGWQSQRSIKVSAFSELEIPIPTLKEQKLIVDILDTHLQRKKLYMELIEAEDKLTSLEIKKIIGGYNK